MSDQLFFFSERVVFECNRPGGRIKKKLKKEKNGGPSGEPTTIMGDFGATGSNGRVDILHEETTQSRY